MSVNHDVSIPLGDGTNLSARMYLPEGSGPFPAVLTSTIYRKEDFTSIRDEHMIEAFARHGYASLIVDARGCGESEGVAWPLADSVNEGRDGADVVEWIAAQSWCDGNVGGWGGSASGRSAFDLAVAAPPHLKAIVPVMPAANLYETTYPGGCDGAFVTSLWNTMMLASDLLPSPIADTTGERWKDWIDRIGSHQPRLVDATGHRDRTDPYWANDLELEKIKVPTFLIGGWADIFRKEVFEGFEVIDAPCKVLVGPWGHTFPFTSLTVPIEHIPLMVAWFDRWLKNDGEGDDGQPVTIYVNGSDKWRTENEWPIARTEERKLWLGDGRTLTADGSAAASTELPYSGDPTVGITSELLDPFGAPFAGALDQGRDDLRSLTFDTEPLAEPTEITGRAEAALRIAVDSGDEVNVVAKLCSVSPNGASTLIGLGWANLRVGEDGPAAGEFADVVVRLVPISRLVDAGQVLRLSISCSDFPRLWPTTTNPSIRLAVGEGSSSLSLPVIPAGDDWEEPQLPQVDPTVNPMPLVLGGDAARSVEHDVIADGVSTRVATAFKSMLPSLKGQLEMDIEGTFRVTSAHPEAASFESKVAMRIALEGGPDVLVSGRTRETRHGAAASAEIEVDGTSIFQEDWRG